MSDGYDIYRIWAPDDSIWSQWAKPVLFANQSRISRASSASLAAKWAPYADARTVLIVDLPGELGVSEGLALAQAGYRPVPLYNGVYGSNVKSMAVDVTGIVDRLFRGANELAALPLRADAPPAFLLDSSRMHGGAKQIGKYDNRWCVFPQDMPSASFLLEQGIRQVCVRADMVQNDLTHILLRYKEKGIGIYHINSAGISKELAVVRPSHFRSFLYRIRAVTGMTRNAAGGFGGMVPEPTQYSGGRYYGIG